MIELQKIIKKPDWVAGNINITDVEFLNSLIKSIKPKKIIEIGVASGFSSAVMLNSGLQARSDFKTLYAFDLNEKFYLDPNRKTGECVPEMIANYKLHYELHTGVISAQINSINKNDIDFAFIDANHMHPWACLDLFCIIPFLKQNSWVALHDIFLNTFERHNHNNRGPYYLYNQFFGKNITSNNNPPTIGAILIEDKNLIIKMLIEILHTCWEVKISDEYLNKFNNHVSRFFNEGIQKEFRDCLSKMNRLNRSETIKYKQDLLSSTSVGMATEVALKERLKTAVRNMQSREFFLQFSRSPHSIGIYPIGHSYYELTRPDGSTHKIRSMLSSHEIVLCYVLAALNWNGKAIVDLGPLMGASSWAFSKGLTDAGYRPDTPVIHSFDLWKSFANYKDYLGQFPVGGAASALGQWNRTLEGYHHLIEPHQGDFLDFTWDGRPIGILFLDLAKSIALNDHVIKTMFPYLEPGAILIQQDYVHYNEYWIHLEMARMRDYFEPLYTLRGATKFYRCIKPIPPEICEASSSQLPYTDQVQLLEDERAQAIAPVREVLKCAAAKHAIENGDFERAHSLLANVSTEPLTDNGVQEFSGIVKSNLHAVKNLFVLMCSQREDGAKQEPDLGKRIR